MTIGERLEEARKRKSVSIREAAEATKIRGDFLIAMESDEFDEVNLPEIYVRGFLKNYAKFLRLDADNILTDYDARQLSQQKWGTSQRHGHTVGNTPPPPMARNAHAQSAAHVAPEEPKTVPPKPQESTEPQPRPSYGQMEIKDGPPAQPKHVPTALTPQIPDEPEGTHSSTDEDKSGVYKIALFSVMTVFILTLFVMLLVRVISDDSPDINPELADQSETAQPAQPQPADTAQAIEPDTFTVRALDNVTVIIEQKNDGQELFRGTLLEGETLDLEKYGPVVIRYTNGSALEIVMEGRRFKMPAEGVGTGRLP